MNFFAENLNFLKTNFEEKTFSAQGPVRLWEFCSGSSVLSATAKAQNISNLPPIDHRFGWDLGRTIDQLVFLKALLFTGVGTLFALLWV